MKTKPKKKTKLDYDQKLRQQAESICDRVMARKVNCKCGGKCRIQVLPYGGSCSARQQIRFRCSRKRCHRRSEWHDDHFTGIAWKEWRKTQPRKKRSQRKSNKTKKR